MTTDLTLAATVTLTTAERHLITGLLMADRPSDEQVWATARSGDAAALAGLEAKRQTITTLVAKLDAAYLASARGGAK